MTTLATSASVATPISGVSPAELKETTIMAVWPSNAKYGLGRLLGQMYAITFPDIYIFRLGNLIALASIPVALGLFFLRIAPFVGIRYLLTNRRVVVQRGLSAKDERWVELDRFDSITVEVQPGQAWYDAGDLIFKQGQTETFRLEGISRPEAFRQTCMKAQMIHAGVRKTRK